MLYCLVVLFLVLCLVVLLWCVVGVCGCDCWGLLFVVVIVLLVCCGGCWVGWFGWCCCYYVVWLLFGWWRSGVFGNVVFFSGWCNWCWIMMCLVIYCWIVSIVNLLCMVVMCGGVVWLVWCFWFVWFGWGIWMWGSCVVCCSFFWCIWVGVGCFFWLWIFGVCVWLGCLCVVWWLGWCCLVCVVLVMFVGCIWIWSVVFCVGKLLLVVLGCFRFVSNVCCYGWNCWFFCLGYCWVNWISMVYWVFFWLLLGVGLVWIGWYSFVRFLL